MVKFGLGLEFGYTVNMENMIYLFDWDGTLADSLPLMFEAFKRTFSEYGIEATYRDIGEKVLGDWQGPKNLGVKNQDEFFEKFGILVDEKCKTVRLNDGAFEMLERLKNSGVKLGILTNSRRKWVEPAIEYNQIGRFVDIFLGKEDVEKAKPDPEMILKAMEKLGVQKEKVVMIGDMDKDVECARRAEVESVLYLPERYELFYDLEIQRKLGADRIITSFEEII